VAIARRANSAGLGGPIVGRRRRWFRKHFDVIDQRHRRFKEQLAERAGPPQSIGGIEWREAFSVRVACAVNRQAECQRTLSQQKPAWLTIALHFTAC
jgi:hypothetical protein